jgi:hypothetical protein
MGAKMGKQKRIAIFIHIPKCAGTTFQHIAEAQIGKDKILGIYGEEAKNPGEVLVGTNLERTELIRGHFAYGIHEFLPPGLVPMYMVLLRRPVPRIVSLYAYITRSKNHPLHSDVVGMTIRDFVKSGVTAETSNAMTAQLSGIHGEYPGVAYQPFEGAIDRRSLELAKQHLHNCSVSGVCEFFNKWIASVNYMMGWRPVEFKNKNVSGKRPRYGLVDEDVIHEYNQLDSELWEYARELR